ncbi:HTH-type transcriptional regulator/antitoxin HigA [Longimicrobium terrae]|uniref:HTH-type transcriptional regulator/antitoxin HigA n=2 Tax=Longimicrobium terrae TaxID=1639882 RepID=A0A841GM20_9BACT|nr:helix-turn-helix domain-containing protein [Longimicrobium terrae]MBB4635437.1 HTH-type transcriptional regulator/antitoxin HigA [Longimicrobium terrae]MBB6069831.1 HTH-type transcriptional regulator/antitoxin HigA [Longimicrobium terrae]
MERPKVMTVIDIPVPHVLRTAEEYDAAVSEIDRLLDLGAEPFSEDADRLELLSVLVEEYDRRNNPIDDSGLTPQDAVDFMLGQRGMTRADLAELMGGRSRVSEFFSGKRELSRGQIAALRDVLGIPADLLM